MNKYLLIIIGCLVSCHAMAQGRPFPITDLPSSPRSLSMGGTTTLRDGGCYVYTQPSNIFMTQDTSMRADYQLGYIDNAEHVNNYTWHTLTMTWRREKQAVCVGMRYLDMGKLEQNVDKDMNQVPGNGKCMRSFSFDMGYALQLNSSLSVYATAALMSERTLLTTNGCALSTGAAYSSHWHNMAYTAALGIRNVGFYSYQNTTKMLTPLVFIGGNISLPTWGNQRLTVAAESGAYVGNGRVKSSCTLSMGAAYSVCRYLSLRMGTHWGDEDNYMAYGLGARLGKISIDTAIKTPVTANVGKMYMVGIGVNI